MKILHLIHTPRHSGAEVLVRDVALQHTNAGHCSGIAGFAPPTTEFQQEIDRLDRAGVSTYLPQRRLAGWSRIRFYLNAIRTFQPDVIMGHSALPSIYGRLACIAALSRVPFISVLHSGTDDYRSLKMRISERAVAHRHQAIVAVSRNAAEIYQGRFRSTRPLYLVPNGIKLSAFKPSGGRDEIRGRLGLNPGDCLILQVGRISDLKQQAFVLRALSSDLKDDHRLQLWFAGLVEEEEYYRDLVALIQSSGMADRVRILGARADVPSLLEAADIFVMPSKAEAQGISLLEALAAGTPIVASQIEPFAFASHMDGVHLVPASDASAFRSAVLRAQRQRGRFSRPLDDYSIDATADRYLNIAKELIAGGAKKA